MDILSIHINKTTLTITDHSIISSQPIIVSSTPMILYIWSVPGICHPGNYETDFPITNHFNKIILQGNHNTLFLEQPLNRDLSLDITGSNIIYIPFDTYHSLHIHNECSVIEFQDSICDEIFVSGNGENRNLIKKLK